MNKELMLPIVLPSVTSYHAIASLFAVLECYPKTKDWIFSNYIQLEAFNINGSPELIMLPGFISPEICPWIINSYLNRDFISEFSASCEDFFVKSLYTHNYVYLYGDQSQFSCCNFKNTFLHDFFMYGYNLDRHTFNIADFTFKSSYSFEEIPIVEVKKAFYNVKKEEDTLYNGHGGIALWRFRQNINYIFDLALVIQSLKDFISSKNSSEDYRSMYNPTYQRIYGVNIYSFLIDYLDYPVEQYYAIIKCLHNLYDHKLLMTERISYLYSNNLLNHGIHLFELYEEIKNNAGILYKLAIKYQITGNEKIKIKMKNMLYLLYEQEKTVISSIIDNINMLSIT